MDRIRHKYANALTKVLETQLGMLGQKVKQDSLYADYLGVDHEAATELINRITFALPNLIVEAEPKMAREVQLDIVDRFILFMVQENQSPQKNFNYTLEEFIHHLIEDIVESNEDYWVAHYGVQ